jgi:hypothetical protein
LSAVVLAYVVQPALYHPKQKKGDRV